MVYAFPVTIVNLGFLTDIPTGTDINFRCYEMERRLKTPDLFKFPYFEAICWYVAKNLLETLKGEWDSELV